jgi:integrase
MRYCDLSDAYQRAWVARGRTDTAQLGRLAYWVELLGDTDHTALTADLIDEGLVALAARGKLDPHGRPLGTPLSGASLNRYKAALGSVLKHAKQSRLVKASWHNPIDDVPAAPEGAGHLEFFTEEQVGAMLRASYLLSWLKMPVLILLAFTTGLRRGNLFEMRWKWVDLEARRVNVPQDQVKNGEPYVAHLTAEAYAALRELAELEDRKARSNDYGLGARAARDPEWLVFGGKNPLKAHNINYLWPKLLELAGVPYQKFHGLRHSTASHAAQNGASEIMLKNLLGHKSLRMVARYAHLRLAPRAEFVDQHFTVALPDAATRPSRAGLLAERREAREHFAGAHVDAWLAWSAEHPQAVA